MLGKWSFSDARFLVFCLLLFCFLIIPKTSDDFIEFLIKLAKNFCANSLKRAPFREDFFGAKTTAEKNKNINFLATQRDGRREWG